MSQASGEWLCVGRSGSFRVLGCEVIGASHQSMIWGSTIERDFVGHAHDNQHKDVISSKLLEFHNGNRPKQELNSRLCLLLPRRFEATQGEAKMQEKFVR